MDYGAGQSAKAMAKAGKFRSGRKLLPSKYGAKLRCASGNRPVAAVDKSGRITAMK